MGVLFGCYSFDRREMTGLTPLVQLKSTKDSFVFPTSSLTCMRRPELKTRGPLERAASSAREQLPETPDIAKHMPFQ
jgi:hypothetical protein